MCYAPPDSTILRVPQFDDLWNVDACLPEMEEPTNDEPEVENEQIGPTHRQFASAVSVSALLSQPCTL